MKKMFFALLLFLGMAFSHTASASIWSWIDTLKSCGSNSCYDYTFTIADWDENDATPNPCYQLSACTLIIGHRHNVAGTSGPGIDRSWDAGSYPFLTTAETMGEVSQQFKAIFTFPYSSTTRHSGVAVNWEECVGFFTQRAKTLVTTRHTSTKALFRATL